MMEGNSNHTQGESSGSLDWEALARHFSGEATAEERARIEAILASKPEAKEALAIADLATNTLRAGIPANLDVEGALSRVKARRDAASVIPLAGLRERKHTEQIPSHRWRVPMPALAAAALIAVGIASWMSYRNRPVEHAVSSAPRMFATGVGARDSITLADGSHVILGPMSSIKIDADFNNRSRGVEVRGDAFFDVIHNAAKPFAVRAGNATIVDVGTRFAVQSDAAQGVTVAVLEGSVALQQVNGNGGSGVILKAGDKGLLSTSGDVIAQRGAVTDDDAAWLNGRLVFREATIGEIASSIRKWYGIELKVEDASLANRHLTATFAGESPDRVLDVIRLALGADIERHGDTAIVSESKGSMRIK
jgi:transmembrane sensor